MTADAALEIVGLGARGDGIAPAAEGHCFVPFALPGERVLPGAAGLPQLLSAPSPERKEPLCRHFGVCGGCAGQHMSTGLYAAWKRGLVVEALRQRGLTAEVAPLVAIAVGSRRRAILTARREPTGIVLGYHPRDSDALFEVCECPVLRPEILARLPALREIAAAVGGREIRLTVLATSAGLDVAVGAERGVAANAVARLAQIAAKYRLARIAVAGQIITQRTPPSLAFAGVNVCPPPGAFVQAVGEAESAIAAEVQAAIGKARRAADLFCGLGTLTFALARGAFVAAFDSDAAAIAALTAAARQAKGLKPIDARVRDLFREPLAAKELDGFDAVVFDPPRAGAKAQAEQLARARVPTVVAVSCSAGTLARDVRILVNGGYRLERVVPIDQFLFSAQVEAVACLRHPG
jgi:23S rRNA (uracil1939-C5)-methyltransferase